MVNLPTAGVDYHVPFGGRKGSSFGSREQGRYAAEFYTSGEDRLYAGVTRRQGGRGSAMILISGEALIDLIPDREQPGRYDAVLGGSPFNVAIGLARLGAPAAFVSRISRDANGEALAGALAASGRRSRLRRPRRKARRRSLS